MSFLRTTIAQSASEMDSIAALWNRLLTRQSHSIFQQFNWNRLAAEIFPDRCTPYVVAVESDTGAAIIPAAINHHANRLELLGENLFDYRDVLHAGDPKLLRLAWELLRERGLPLEVNGIEAEATSRWPDFPLADFCRAPGVKIEEVGEQRFRSAHSRLGRHFRRLQKHGINLHHSTGADSALIRHLYQRKGERLGGDVENVFRDPQRCEFMVTACAIENRACDVFTLQTAAGELVAGIVSFREIAIRRFYTIYFDPHWARFSPGIVLLYEVTARSLAEGLVCDYMTGEYSYKLRFANASRPLYRLQASASDVVASCSTHLLEKAG